MKVKVDSRKVEPGDVFVAVGNGHDYVEEAIRRGATKIIAEYGTYSLPVQIVKNSRAYVRDYLEKTYKEEMEELTIIGITGTNGKTTTCYLIYEALNKLGIPASYIGTIGFYTGNKNRDLTNTTPDLLDLYEMFLESLQEGRKVITMEVSSHGLSMDRTEGILYDYAIFTNLTKDHLDYHKNMENYALAKQKLFKQLKPNGQAIVNLDSPYQHYFLLEENKNITYGFSGGDYQVTSYELQKYPTSFVVKNDEGEFEIQTLLLGKHNIYNTMVTAIVLRCLGVDMLEVKDVMKELSAPKGRMDVVPFGSNKIIVDYAHTPDAVENAIHSVIEMKPNNIYTIVGCGGNRDRTKRPEMAKIATHLSTQAIFTSDNPRMEDPEDILNDMIEGLDNGNYLIEENREDAIKKGIQLLEKNDILLILGKGHETYQIIKNEVIHFDDKEKVLEIIRR